MSIKKPQEIEKLREGGRILAAVLKRLISELKAGLKTIELDRLAEKLIYDAGGEPSFKGYRALDSSFPFPATVCVSVNDEVVHGIPSERILKAGDIVGLDIGMKYQGLFTDMAETVAVGKPDRTAKKLMEVTRKSLDVAIAAVRPGAKTGDIGEAVQKFVEQEGFGIVRELVGHGVGYKVHEDPEIPNWGTKGTGVELKENMVIAIEPMVTEGKYQVYLAPDGWTWKTRDKKRAAHFEHTLVVTKKGAEVLTRL